MPDMLKNCGAATHRGYKRRRNEDRYLIKPFPDNRSMILAVADGIGGEAGGDVSAQIVVDALQKHHFPSEANAQNLTDILVNAGEKIIRRADTEPELEGMGTTATVAFVHNGRVSWSHVGDSRLYLFRDDRLVQITTDHTFVQDLIDDGILSQHDADQHPLRNMLDQCVGCLHLVPDSGSFRLKEEDKLLICSDGLTRQVSENDIKTILQNHSISSIAERLVRLALAAGGKDNVTVVVMKYPVF